MFKKDSVDRDEVGREGGSERRKEGGAKMCCLSQEGIRQGGREGGKAFPSKH